MLQLTYEQRFHLRHRAHYYMEEANRIFKTNIAMPAVSFDEKGRVAGRAYYDTLEVGFNEEIAYSNWERFEKTVAHEVAHLVAYIEFGESGHGKAWKRVMRAFGFEPDRCHSYDMSQVSVRRQRRWEYACACRVHKLSTTRHNRMKKGRIYRCMDCKVRLVRGSSPVKKAA